MFRVVRFRPGRFWSLPVLLIGLMMIPMALQLQSVRAASVYDPQSVEEKMIYLTFDDGPSANTEALLDVLAEYGVKATFFITGQYEGDKEGLLQEIDAEGHTLGLHTYCHMYDEIYSYSEAFFDDLALVDQLLYQATGQHGKYYRFPGGSANSHCPDWLRAELKQELSDRGYVYFDWNVVSGDQGSRVCSAQELFENVTKGAQKVKQGPLMVLFHDTNHCSTTPEAVEMVLEYFQAKGWKFLPITEATQPIRF